MRKIKILRSVLSFIAMSKKHTETDSPTEDLSPDTMALKNMIDPNNVNLPEANLEEFEKVNDFSAVHHKKSIFNNQMSLLSSDSSEALLKKMESLQSPAESFKKKNIDSMSPINTHPLPNNNNEFKIKIHPLQENNNSSVVRNSVSGSILSVKTPNSNHHSSGTFNSNNASPAGRISEKNQNKSTISRIMASVGSPKKADHKVSFKSIVGNEGKENVVTEEDEKMDKDSEKKSESSDDDNDDDDGSDSVSKGDESDSEDAIDVIEEEDEEEDNSEKNSEIENDTIDNNLNVPSEAMTNRENQKNPVINTPKDGDEKGESPSSMIPEHNEEVEEVETLEDDINPNIDMNLLIEVYEDKQDFNHSQKLRNRKQYLKHQWVIYPDDAFKSSWSLLLALILMYTCLVTPYRVAFLSNQDNTESWFIIDWSTDSVFWFDVLVNFVSAYYDINDNLIFEKRSIFWNYLTGWFFFDVIGVIPFDYMFDVSRYGNLMRVAKLPRLYKLIRMTKLIRVLKLVKERNTVIKYLMDIFSIGAGFERLFVSICSIFVFCHLASCFWFMAADLNDSPINWVAQYNLVDNDNIDVYIASFYWITQTVVTVGYGDITAVNTIERSIACVYMFVGVFFYSFTIGSLSSLLSSLDSKNATFDQKLNTLIQIRNQYNIDSLLYNRVKRALKYGTTQKDDEKMTFLNELPLNLRIELSVIMHRNIVQGVEFFKNKPATFIALIGPYLKPFHIGKDEYIFQEGEYADEMYFIKEGEVSIVLKEFNNFEFMTIAKGYHFGEVDLLFGDTRKYTYMASTDVELLALSKKDFTKIFFTEFRDIGCELFTNAHKRRLRSNKYHKEAVEYCQKQAEKKKSYLADRSVKSSIYGYRPMISIAKKSNMSTQRDSDVMFKQSIHGTNINNFLDIAGAQEQEIKESEEKAKMLEAIIEEKTTSFNEEESKKNQEEGGKNEEKISTLSTVEVEKKENGENLQEKPKFALAKLTDLVVKSNLAKKSLGLDKLLAGNMFNESANNNDVVSEGLKQMNAMENKMKNIENNMDEIFQFYKSLGIEMEKPVDKEKEKEKEQENLQISPKQRSIKKSTILIKSEENKEKETNEEAEKQKEENGNEKRLSLGAKTLGFFRSFKNKKI